MIELRGIPFDAKEIIDPSTGGISYDKIHYSRDVAEWIWALVSIGTDRRY